MWLYNLSLANAFREPEDGWNRVPADAVVEQNLKFCNHPESLSGNSNVQLIRVFVRRMLPRGLRWNFLSVLKSVSPYSIAYRDDVLDVLDVVSWPSYWLCFEVVESVWSVLVNNVALLVNVIMSIVSIVFGGGTAILNTVLEVVSRLPVRLLGV